MSLMSLVRIGLRRKGRVFAKDRLLDLIMDRIDVKDKVVFEIGAGDGRLTKRLALNARKVIAIEKDESLYQKAKFFTKQFENVKLVHGDIRDYEIPPVDVIIGNIPYYLSSYIIFNVLKNAKFDEAVIMVQKEFADRMMAEPGDRNYGRLSVMTQTYFRVERLMNVKPGMFEIRPKVESSVVRLRKKETEVPPCFDELVNLLFQRRRKTLRKGMMEVAGSLGVSPELVETLPKELLKERIFKLGIDKLIQIAKVVGRWRSSSTGNVKS